MVPNHLPQEDFEEPFSGSHATRPVRIYYCKERRIELGRREIEAGKDGVITK